MRRAAALAVVLAVGIAVPATSSGAGSVERGKHKTVKVKVADDFFSPVKEKIKKNDKVKFAWSDSNTDSHNVTLTKGPKGVKKGCPTKGKNAYSDLISKCNKSSTGAIGIKFKKKFDKKGTYNFVCTIHPDVMQMTVKVK
jgi:plastocyanin